ncbi:hypothetical protein Athai_11080 [Actinocatenispora thailandica]|uniref:DUF5753 domain-containing protein n=1 Tax=Actinocatenispora thailandica TaxID=227318 RepID=A0A7R7DL94_9ACTN|nr:hypothetical protein Athai_11080 [Actinocatenispora thailandica]
MRTKKSVRYEIVLDELVLRRRTAPDDVLETQPRWLVMAAQVPNVEIRVLPIEADLGYHHSPVLRSLTSYSYPAAPSITVIETETTEAPSTGEDQLDRYSHAAAAGPTAWRPAARARWSASVIPRTARRPCCGVSPAAWTAFGPVVTGTPDAR